MAKQFEPTQAFQLRFTAAEREYLLMRAAETHRSAAKFIRHLLAEDKKSRV